MSRALHYFRAEWAPSIPRELMAGAVATFALIPGVIAFAGDWRILQGCIERVR